MQYKAWGRTLHQARVSSVTRPRAWRTSSPASLASMLRAGGFWGTAAALCLVCSKGWQALQGCSNAQHALQLHYEQPAPRTGNASPALWWRRHLTPTPGAAKKGTRRHPAQTLHAAPRGLWTLDQHRTFRLLATFAAQDHRLREERLSAALLHAQPATRPASI